MSKHTPGPWFAFDETPCVGGPEGLNGMRGVAMCGMKARTPEEAMANARLIAAAPELLEALEMAMGILAMVAVADDTDCAAQLRGTREAAINAIRKAKGK